MSNINEENIRVAAYYIWEQAGRPEGAEKECWFKACEQFLRASKKKASDKKATAVKKTPAKAAATEAKSTKKPVAKKPAASKTPFYGVKK